MTETIVVNLIKNKKISDSKLLTWPQNYEDFIKDIKETFQLNQNSKIILTLFTKDEDDYTISSQDDLDTYLEGVKQFNVEFEEVEPKELPGQNPQVDGQNPPMPNPDILEIDIDKIIKEVFNNDKYKKELEINNKKLSDNFKSNLELSINNIIEEKQKVLVNDIDSKLKIIVDDFSKKQNENKGLVSEIKEDFEEIKDKIGEMNSAIKEFKDKFNPEKLSIILSSDMSQNQKRKDIPGPGKDVIIDDNIKPVKFEQKNIEKIIEMKDAKFININNINIKNVGNTSIHKLYFFRDQEKSSNDFIFFGNSKLTDEYELSMPDELKPNNSLNCNITMKINYPKAVKEYKAIIYAKEKDEIISEPFEIIIKIKEEKEDPMKQIMVQANQIYEEINNQFPNHDNLINKNDIINKLINNNLNKNVIINDINNKIKEIEQKEKDVKSEQIYNDLNLNNINIDKNEVIEIIKNKNFDKEEIQKLIDEKAQMQNKERAQNLYNNLRNESLDFSKCPNEEAILNKIIELKFIENEIKNFFKKEGGKKEDPKVMEIFEELETEYGLTSIKEKEEIIDKIIGLKCDKDKINEWVEAVVSGDA